MIVGCCMRVVCFNVDLVKFHHVMFELVCSWWLPGGVLRLWMHIMEVYKVCICGGISATINVWCLVGW